MRYGHFIMAIFFAWVLWGEGPPTLSGANIFAVSGFDDRASCEAERTVSKQIATELNHKNLYVCLPDTIDPRTAKASR